MAAMHAPSELLFATGNEHKLREAREILRRPVLGGAMELEEIQTVDLRALILHKTAQAYALQRRALFVEDTVLAFGAWRGLPGPFIKFFLERLGAEGLVRALQPFGDMSAQALCGVGYHDGAAMHYFEGRVAGTIVPPRGAGGFGWDPIFQPQGTTQTFAEMDAAAKHALSMRAQALRHMAAFLDAS